MSQNNYLTRGEMDPLPLKDFTWDEESQNNYLTRGEMDILRLSHTDSSSIVSK